MDLPWTCGIPRAGLPCTSHVPGVDLRCTWRTARPVVGAGTGPDAPGRYRGSRV